MRDTDGDAASGRGHGPIELGGLRRQLALIRGEVDAAIGRVLDHGQFIMGPEVAELERRLAAHCGARHAITCSNGTDALVMALMAKGVGPGDCVVVPSFTFCATAEAVCAVGAAPLFADVSPSTFNMGPEELLAALARAGELGLRVRGVITVDLFGLPCDYGLIEPIARENGLFLVCDAAQAFGASYRGRAVGRFGDLTTTSFFPAKPLGCYGDGGAVLTDDDEAAAVLRSIRVHGQGADKYDNVRVGMNGRLDTLQAAVLLCKLDLLPGEIEARGAVAGRYEAGLGDLAATPRAPAGARSAWAQYTLAVADRDGLARALRREGIATAVYYARPLHLQEAYRRFPRAAAAGAGLPESERLAGRVLSLPMHPYLDAADQDRVIGAARRFLAPRPKAAAAALPPPAAEEARPSP